jgi:hypothetical protein
MGSVPAAALGGGADGGQVRVADRRGGHRGARPVRAHAARLQHGHLDAERGDLLGEDGRETADGPLRALVGGQPDRADAAADRGDLEEVARALLAQDREHGLGHVDHAVEVGVDLRLEVVERDVLDGGEVAVAGVVDHDVQAAERGDRFLDGASDGRVVSAQAAVLERNVSTDVALRYKRAAARHRDVLTDLIRRHLPETGDAAEQLCRHIILVTGAIATHARPSASVVAAYEADPAIGAMRIDFTEYLRTTVATLAAGTLARAS